MMECECGAYKGDGPVCQRCDTWIDTQARGEDELRKLAKERDEAAAVYERAIGTLKWCLDGGTLCFRTQDGSVGWTAYDVEGHA